MLTKRNHCSWKNARLSTTEYVFEFHLYPTIPPGSSTWHTWRSQGSPIQKLNNLRLVLTLAMLLLRGPLCHARASWDLLLTLSYGLWKEKKRPLVPLLFAPPQLVARFILPMCMDIDKTVSQNNCDRILNSMALTFFSMVVVDVHVHLCALVNQCSKRIYGEFLKHLKKKRWRFPQLSILFWKQNQWKKVRWGEFQKNP